MGRRVANVRFGSEAAKLIGTVGVSRPLCHKSGQTGRTLAKSALCQNRLWATAAERPAYSITWSARV